MVPGQFVTWTEETEFSISEKLAITHIKVGDGDPVRGVVVLKDIQQGETLCNLPLDMGLYDNETEVRGEVDAWDRAAARLLREKYFPLFLQSKLLSLPNVHPVRFTILF
jgi:hypothetical protein